MGDKENSSLNKRYPERTRTKVKYEEFEMSMEKKPKNKKDKPIKEELEEDEVSSENEEHSSEEEEVEEVSEYEKLRLKNLEENRRVMIELGLIDPNKEEKKKALAAPRPKPVKVKKKDVKKDLEPQKRSLRIQKKTPEGQALPLDLFQETPPGTPSGIEEKTRLEEESLPMNEDGESLDFLDSLKSSLSQSSTVSSQESVDMLIQQMRDLELVTVQKVNSSRIQNMCVHPLEQKLLVISGSKNGELALWNVTDGDIAQFTPHVRAINCITVDPDDYSKFYTTSHDGTVRRADVNKSAFQMVYQTDEKVNMCHTTWHEHADNNTMLIAHGTGEVGIVDLRASSAQRWFHCHPRSVRTIHMHPIQPNYFLTTSGIGECKVWDIRGSHKKHEDTFVSEFKLHGKGLTSAFFSPDGTKVVTTGNDDFLRVYNVSDLTNPTEKHKIIHDNHTGRWLTVFRAVWHPQSSDLILVGSMLEPRKIQMYNSSCRLVKELVDDNLTTINSVVAVHPTLPSLVGGNSTGKAHVFTTPESSSRLIKFEDDDNI